MGNSRILILALACGAALLACGGQKTEAQSGKIAMSVTEAGYEPDNLTVKKGKEVQLVITRKTDATCAKEILIDEYKINTKLPLNQAVTVAFTPTQSGKLKFGCAMDKMISGSIVVE